MHRNTRFQHDSLMGALMRWAPIPFSQSAIFSWFQDPRRFPTMPSAVSHLSQRVLKELVTAHPAGQPHHDPWGLFSLCVLQITYIWALDHCSMFYNVYTPIYSFAFEKVTSVSSLDHVVRMFVVTCFCFTLPSSLILHICPLTAG